MSAQPMLLKHIAKECGLTVGELYDIRKSDHSEPFPEPELQKNKCKFYDVDKVKAWVKRNYKPVFDHNLALAFITDRNDCSNRE